MEQTCSICGYIAANTKQAYIHLGVAHYKISEEDIHKSSPKKRKYERNEHYSHAKKLPFNQVKKGKDCKCTICGARLISTRKLFDHLRREHYGRDYHELEPVFKKQKTCISTNEQVGFGAADGPLTEPVAGPSHSTEPVAGPSHADTIVSQQPLPNTSVQQRINEDHSLRMPTEEELRNDEKQDSEPSMATNYFQLREISRRHSQKYNAENIVYRMELSEELVNRRLVDVQHHLYDMFQDLLRNLRNELQIGDLIRIYMNHPDLHVPIMIPAREIQDLQAEDIMAEVEKVLQSEEELKLDENFEIHVGILRIPRGGRGRKDLFNNEQFIAAKRSIVRIENEQDNLCFDRSLAVSLAKLDKDTSKQKWKQITDKRYSVQKKMALELRRKVGLPENIPVSIQQIGLYEDALDVQIIVISLNKTILHHGRTNTRKIFLYHENEHFHSIINISGFYGKNNYCKTCLIAYNHANHTCATSCTVCQSKKCEQKDQIKCNECNMICRSQECFERHRHKRMNNPRQLETCEQTDNLSRCEKFWKCEECHVILNRKKREPTNHTCGEYLCSTCHQYVMSGHLCYQRYLAPKKHNGNFVFYDFECRQDAIAECAERYTRPPKCSDNDCKGNSCPKCNLCTNCKQTWCGKNKHIPNYVIAHTVCNRCMNDPVDKTSRCNGCGVRCDDCNKRNKDGKYLKEACLQKCGFQERIFKGEDTCDLFSKWLFDRKRAGFTVIAHNMSGYDGYFLLEYLLKNGNKPDSIIYQGSKITYMEVKKGLNIRMIDSLKFLPMRLANLSKAFGLCESKGWFPHYFNTQANWNYVGTFPDPKYYGESRMSSDESRDFLKWHSEQVNNGIQFDFQKSMEHYCRSDVSILRQACLTFRKLMLEATTTKVGQTERPGVDPWSEITIASVCSQIYRAKFLEEEWSVKISEELGVVTETRWVKGKLRDGVLLVKLNERDENSWVPEDQVDILEKHFVSSPIAELPTGGYIPNDNYSNISIIWLDWLMKQKHDQGDLNYHIVHAINGTEKRIPHTSATGGRSHFRCDGWHAESRTIFEFLGCRAHCCPTCYTGDARHKIRHPNTNQTMNQLYLSTLKRQQYLEGQDYNYVSIWECDFRKQMSESPELKRFASEHKVSRRMELRESFKGGRTNATKLYHKCNDNERIRYIDFTSLYGYVNKYAEYPCGHPSIITNVSKDSKISDFFGIAKVCVRAPRGLFHPVLPLTIGDKLMFPLCKKCAIDKNVKSCGHSDAQREFTGTWCTPELIEAEARGYIIVKIHEVYHWEKTIKYNSETKEGGLFAEYINTFLKIKQESSDWPKWCTDGKSRQKYIDNYYEREGIRLDPEKIKHNPGLRSLAKLLLVNMWGKWGQSSSHVRTEFVDNLAHLSEIMVDPMKEIHDFQLITDEILMVQYRYIKEFETGGKKTNIFIAAFTTCFARLKLYSELHRLGTRVLYTDTDSIIFLSREGQYEPELGDYLGEFTCELSCKDVGCNVTGCLKRHYIEEFISAGPKNYSYRTDIQTTKCKVRGFTLNKCTSMLINFDFMKEMVTACNDSNINRSVTEPSKITRHKTKSMIYNRPLSKRYRKVYDKRVILSNYETRPFGF